MTKFQDHFFIYSTIFFTVYSQLIMRWQVPMAGLLPDSFAGRISFIYSLFLNPWIISAVFATFLAGVSWMMVMTKFEISYAFPFVALNYAIIMFAGFLLFHEVISLPKIIGCFLVVLGIVVISRG